MSSAQWVSTSMPYLRARADQGDAWAAEAAAHGGRGTQRIAFAGEVTPPDDVARLLGVEGGPPVVMRRRIISLDDQPVEIADSYYPAQLARGTALAESRKIPGGAVSLLARLGHVGHQVQEDVTARMPTNDELAVLALEPTEPLLVLTRLTRDENGQPVQAEVMVTPGRRRRLRYELRVG